MRHPEGPARPATRPTTRCKITDEAIARRRRPCPHRYIADRYLPDKAIDLIDEAGSRVRLRTYTAPKDLQRAGRAAERAAPARRRPPSTPRTSSAPPRCAIRRRACRRNWSQAERNSGRREHRQDRPGGHRARISPRWSPAGPEVPVSQLTEAESERLLRHGGHAARAGHRPGRGGHGAVAKAIRRGRAGLERLQAAPSARSSSWGPPAWARPSSRKALAEALFGDENAMIRLDMSEYMEKHTVSKLIGSPSGLRGL